MLQKQSVRPVKTFTIGFHESDYQEAHFAKSIATHLRTDHTELYVTPREAMDVIPGLPGLYDEPFGDSSAIPTYLVSRLARKQVAVSLSGDGGDELFGGYARYRRADEIWRATRRIPSLVRRVAGHGLKTVFRASGPDTLGASANRMAQYLSARDTAGFYGIQVSQRQDIARLILDAEPDAGTNALPDARLSGGNLYDVMMYTDSMSYLPDDILVKVDRASMAVSLEARVPMLDHRIVEFAWSLPLHMKVRKREGKWLLKQLLRKHVPAALLDRPKMGFGIPVDSWIRGPLREWAEDLLDEIGLRNEGLLNPRLIRAQWRRHLNGSGPGSDSIWQLLAFESWLRESKQTPYAGRFAAS